jgi:hypothetical protein
VHCTDVCDRHIYRAGANLHSFLTDASHERTTRGQATYAAVVRSSAVAGRDSPVSHRENSPTFFLEFHGVRNPPHAVAKDRRMRIALSVDRAADLRRRLFGIAFWLSAQ